MANDVIHVKWARHGTVVSTDRRSLICVMCQCSTSVFGEHFSAWDSSWTAVQGQRSLSAGIFLRDGMEVNVVQVILVDIKAYPVEVWLCLTWCHWTCFQGKKIILKGAFSSCYSNCWEIGILLLSAAVLYVWADAELNNTQRSAVCHRYIWYVGEYLIAFRTCLIFLIRKYDSASQL